MFQVGEIVLYRLLLAQVIEIKEGSDCHLYLLTSLESENCQYEVPAKNLLGHLQPLPSPQETHAMLASLNTLPFTTIARNAVDRCCKSFLESYSLTQWLSLLKTLFADKLSAELAGRRFSESEKRYYAIVLERITVIFSAALHQERARCEQLILDALESCVQEG